MSTTTADQHTGSMSVMNRKGDLEIKWSATNAREVTDAEKIFNQYRKDGYLAFRVYKSDNAKGDEMKRFDAHAEKIVLVPPMAGG